MSRLEHDFLGEMAIADDVYYGIQTRRAMENFTISGITLAEFPAMITALALVKKAAAAANMELGCLPHDVGEAICAACDELADGKLHDQFPVDCIQGGAGTSTNMNANEVIANRALELLDHAKGEYAYCHPNNHVNCSQSTNDVYPTALRLALFNTLIGTGKADKRWFVGVPSPTAAALIVGLIWVNHSVENFAGEKWWALFITLFAGLSMVVQIPFWSFKEINIHRKVPFFVMILVMLGLLILALKPALVLFLFFLGYSLSGYVMYGWRFWKKRQRKQAAPPTASR